MIKISFKTTSVILICLFLLLFSFASSECSSISFLTLEKENSSSNAIPFNDFYLSYNLKAQQNNTATYNLLLNVSYLKISSNNDSFNYQQNLVLKSFLFVFLGESQENATFFENSLNRVIQLNKTEGNYISLLIFNAFPFNSTSGALNWDPFWIEPDVINETYPIYSLYMNVSQRTTIGPNDISLFNYSRPVIVLNGKQNVNTTYGKISNTFGLIYDNYTGFLIKGVIDTYIINSNSITHYYSNFELDSTNGFNAFPPYSLPENSTSNVIIIPQELQKPNYWLLLGILFLPLLVTIVRFLRLKEISGGLE